MAYASGRGGVTFERQEKGEQLEGLWSNSIFINTQVICIHSQVLAAPNQLVGVGRNRMTETCSKSLATEPSQRTLRKKGCSRRSPGPGMIIIPLTVLQQFGKKLMSSRPDQATQKNQRNTKYYRVSSMHMYVSAHVHVYAHVCTGVSMQVCRHTPGEVDARCLPLLHWPYGGRCLFAFLFFCVSLLFNVLKWHSFLFLHPTQSFPFLPFSQSLHLKF